MRSIEAFVAFWHFACAPSIVVSIYQDKRWRCAPKPHQVHTHTHWTPALQEHNSMRFSPAICCCERAIAALRLRAQMYLTVSSRCIMWFGSCKCLIFVGAHHLFTANFISRKMDAFCTHRNRMHLSIQFQSLSSLLPLVAFDSWCDVLSVCVHCGQILLLLRWNMNGASIWRYYEWCLHRWRNDNIVGTAPRFRCDHFGRNDGASHAHALLFYLIQFRLAQSTSSGFGWLVTLSLLLLSVRIKWFECDARRMQCAQINHKIETL